MRMPAQPLDTLITAPAPISPLPYEADRETVSARQRPALRLLPRVATTHEQNPAQGKHLLVVDSDAPARDALATFLRQRGYRVWGAATATEAHAMLTYRLPDLLLLETHLDGVSGVDLIRQLRHRQRTTLLPLIIISALATPRDIRNGLAIGADDYITKPLELSIVEARINALLRRDARMRQELAPLAPVELPALNMAAELN